MGESRADSGVYSAVYSGVPVARGLGQNWAEAGMAVGRDYVEIDATIGTHYFIELGQG